jgi:NTE family protein
MTGIQIYKQNILSGIVVILFYALFPTGSFAATYSAVCSSSLDSNYPSYVEETDATRKIIYKGTKRPKVAVVLCGGGAKGAAHVGALKVLEDAGIKPDLIIGTSIGGIVGGIYALGYNATRLDSIIRGLDWNFLLSDNSSRKNVAFKRKMLAEVFSVQIPFYTMRYNSGGLKVGDNKDNSSVPQLPGGFVTGQNIINVMSDLAGGYQDSINFKDLPIPFACMATDLATGEEVVLDHGQLPIAMRATMAIPGFFTPIRIGGRVLVDGGMVNNFPTDVARKMGADIIIGVDIQNDLANEYQLNSVNQVLSQIMGLMGNDKYLKNIEEADIYIKPDVSGFTTFSFNSAAVDSLITNGYKAAMEKKEEIAQLAAILSKYPDSNIQKRIATRAATEVNKDLFFIKEIEFSGVSRVDGEWLLKQAGLERNRIISGKEINNAVSILSGTKTFSSVTYQIVKDSLSSAEKLILDFKRGPSNIVGFGMRFDSEEMAAILVYLGIHTYDIHGSMGSITGRLSYNPYGRVDYSYVSRNFPKINFSYKFQSSDMNIYQRKSSSNHLKFYYNSIDFSFANRYLRNFDFQLGARFESFNFTQFLSSVDSLDFTLKARNYLSYYLKAVMDDRDSKIFPTSGMKIDAEGSFFQTGFKKGFNQFAAVKFNIEGAVSLSDDVVLQPSLYSRFLFGNMDEYAFLNFAGGSEQGRYVNQQIPFVGINYANVFRNNIVVGSAELRVSPARNHYVSGIANYLRTGNDFVYLFNTNGTGYLGFAVKYAYQTTLGPLSINFHWSDYNKKVGCYVNFGYYF